MDCPLCLHSPRSSRWQCWWACPCGQFGPVSSVCVFLDFAVRLQSTKSARGFSWLQVNGTDSLVCSFLSNVICLKSVCSICEVSYSFLFRFLSCIGLSPVSRLMGQSRNEVLVWPYGKSKPQYSIHHLLITVEPGDTSTSTYEYFGKRANKFAVQILAFEIQVRTRDTSTLTDVDSRWQHLVHFTYSWKIRFDIWKKATTKKWKSE